MDWNRLTLNPRVLPGYYASAPDLDGATLHSLLLVRDGPCAELVVQPREFPQTPSRRWPEGANACQLTLRAIGLREVSIDAWGTGVVGDLQIERESDGLVLEFRGEASFRLRCSHLQLAQVSGYVEDAG